MNIKMGIGPPHDPLNVIGQSNVRNVNARRPIITIFSCDNGYFAEVTNGGAQATIVIGTELSTCCEAAQAAAATRQMQENQENQTIAMYRNEVAKAIGTGIAVSAYNTLQTGNDASIHSTIKENKWVK